MTNRRALAVINLVGGPLVLASYWLWLSHPSNEAQALWGGIGEPGRTLYTASMFAAAAGYFAFESYLMFRAPAPRGDDGLGGIVVLHALFLFPSALWMPLTFEYLDGPTPGLWWTIRLTLGIVGGAALLLVGALARIPNDRRRGGHAAAMLGAAAFAFQTGLLDALIWPWYFPR